MPTPPAGQPSLARTALDTQRICQDGFYFNSKGYKIGVAKALSVSAYLSAVADASVFKGLTAPEGKEGPTTNIEVTVESSLEAARRLAGPGTVLLNFASARRPGGGWLRGAQAQEESIARASGLVDSLNRFPAFYERNKVQEGGLYLDDMVFSGNVPFFRDDFGNLLDEPYTVSVITSPAPNLGALADWERSHVEETVCRRARNIVFLASNSNCKTLILGAWGCGVFRNDPEMVANAFKDALQEFKIERVVFAILGPDGLTHNIFREVLQCT